MGAIQAHRLGKVEEGSVMLTHKWVEQYRDLPGGPALAQGVHSAVQFDLGDADDLPLASGVDFADARPPFNNCVLQFSLPKAKDFSHLLIFWRTMADDCTHLMSAWKMRGSDEWRTTAPREITRTTEGFHYEGVGYDESMEAVQRAHAMALNAFYILGCANVQTIDHSPPSALNRKRARSGKFPILTHKTLVVVVDAARHTRVEYGGTHSSPRVHLRRGHVRRLDEARRVWVQPCVVGSKHGVVTKDYRVTTQPAANK